MATKVGGATKEKKGKKPHRNKPSGKKWEHYVIEGDNIKRDKAIRC